MPATADKLVPTAQDVLISSLERGVTGRLSRRSARGPAREVYVMQGQILAAHGPDDGPWIVRRLVNSGALTERQGKAFIRRLTRGIPFEELILGHVPDRLLEDLLAARFRQNLLDFLSSPPPIDFQAMDTLFVPNLQSGHDTRRVLGQVVALRERIGPLMRHRGPLTLRLGPSMPSSRNEARLVDLCDPPISLRDLLTYSPFETGETLDHVMAMLENGALVSDEGIRLQRTRGHGPTADYAVEELFALDAGRAPEPEGVPAAPIAPEHLALLREESETPVLGDFGRIPAAFRDSGDTRSTAELPTLGASHLVLVGDNDHVPSASTQGPDSRESVIPVLVESAPSLVGSQADLTQPSTGLFEDEDAPSPLSTDRDLFAGSGRFGTSDHGSFSRPGLAEPPHPSEPLAELVEPEPVVSPEPEVVPEPMASEASVDDDSVPESWRDLSVLGFGSPSATLDPDDPPVTAVAAEEDITAPEPLPAVESIEAVHVYEEPSVDAGADHAYRYQAEPIEDSIPPADFGPIDDPLDVPSEAPPSSTIEPETEPETEPKLESEAPEPIVPEPSSADEDAIFGDSSLQSLFADEELDPPSAPDFGSPAQDAPEPEPEPGLEEATSGSALVDAARRYLEEAQVRRKERNKKPARRDPDPEPVAASSGEKKFTGFDFDVDDAEMAMFADHDRYRGNGQGQFTLGKNLLDKVELLPERKPERVRLNRPAPEPDLPEEESLIEMGEATAEEEAEAGVVALAFSAPKLDADQVLYKISVAGEVALAASRQLDAYFGPGVGQTTIQLLVDAAAGPYARLFQQVVVAEDGTIDEDQIFANLQHRPQAERRSLLDRGLKDFIERALSTAAEELPDDALDAMLSEVAGYQQRLRM